MTAKPSEGWPAQRPSDDFAGRTVAAILRDRAVVPRRGPRARWFGAMGIAAVLVAAGAWARVAVPKAPATQRSRVEPVTIDVAVRSAPEPVKPEPKPPAPVAPPAQSARAPGAAASARRAHEPPPAQDPGRKVRVPMCNCVQGICDCGEER